MKQMMIGMMSAMMPYMMPLVYIGGGLLAFGIVMAIAKLVSGSGGGLLRLVANLLVVLGIFFLACQVAGLVLGAHPGINFGDSTKFEFNIKPFWMIGLALFVPGIVLRMISGSRS